MSGGHLKQSPKSDFPNFVNLPIYASATHTWVTFASSLMLSTGLHLQNGINIRIPDGRILQQHSGLSPAPGATNAHHMIKKIPLSKVVFQLSHM